MKEHVDLGLKFGFHRAESFAFGFQVGSEIMVILADKGYFESRSPDYESNLG